MAEPPIERLIAGMTSEELREVVSAAADRHEDVARHVRLVGGRDGDLAQLRAEVDRALRTRRFLDYRATLEWAASARLVVDELERVPPSQALVELLQRAVGHVVKVMLRADDSAGALGNVVDELLVLHARACDAGVADPKKLAAWMVRFRFDDQDFFEVDPVRYAAALGDEGLAAYRAAVAARADDRSFAYRYARKRLAILDRDLEAIVELLGGDLTNPQQFAAVAEAMHELELPDEVLKWARRGIAETSGWQTAKLYDFACEVHAEREEPLEVLALRRAHHERMPSSRTYAALRAAADVLGAWSVERDAARAVLQRTDEREFVRALLDEGDVDAAWAAAHGASLGTDLGLRLAEARGTTRPDDALAVYLRVADEVLAGKADRRTYRQAVKILKRARKAADTAGLADVFDAHLADLRERYRRRPSLLDELKGV